MRYRWGGGCHECPEFKGQVDWCGIIYSYHLKLRPKKADPPACQPNPPLCPVGFASSWLVKKQFPVPTSHLKSPRFDRRKSSLHPTES